MSRFIFADDIALLSKSAEHLEKMLEKLKSEIMTVGLKINMNKSTAMRNMHAKNVLLDETLEEVKEYNYLGRIVRVYPNHEREIRRRISWVEEPSASTPK